MNYQVYYIKKSGKDFSTEIQRIIDLFANDDFELHSITPNLDGGTTVGFLLTFYCD